MDLLYGKNPIFRIHYLRSMKDHDNSIGQCIDWSCSAICPLVPDFLQEPLLSASDVSALNENGTWKILNEVCL